MAEDDPLGKNITKLCENTIRDSLIADFEKDSIETQFMKVKAPVNIAVCGFRSLATDEKNALESSIRLLHRIPNLRIALTLNVLNLARQEFTELKQYSDKVDSNKKAFRKCCFHFGESESIPAILLMGLKTIADMQNGLKELTNTKKSDMFEIIRPLSDQNMNMGRFAALVGNIDMDKSVLEGALDIILSFMGLVLKNQWVVHRDPKKDKIEPSDFHELIIETLSDIIKPLVNELKKASKQVAKAKELLNLSVMTSDLVYKICEFLLLDGVKLSKTSLAFTKKILNCLVASSQTNAEVVSKFLNAKINDRLREKINSL